MCSFSDRIEKHQNIVNKLEEEYKEASFWLPFSAVQIKEVFSKDELADIAQLIDEMENAKDDNLRIVRLKEKIDQYSGVVVKLLKMSGIF